jgi:hypothetical protein
MKVETRWVGKYVDVTVKFDNGTTIELGLLDNNERRDLRDAMKDACEELTDD